MKAIYSGLFVFTLLTAGFCPRAEAQAIYIKVRPAVPVVVRPVAPSPRHVWIAEEWRPNGATYVYSGGYWALPPRAGGAWVPGHWHTRHGNYFWVPGHWR